MEFLKDLDPSTLLVVGLVLILREIFAFLAKKDRPIRVVPEVPIEMQFELKAMLKTLEKVGDHIEAQTDLVKGFVHEMHAMRNDLESFKKDFRADLDYLANEVNKRMG